jgi:multiple antibiotic resistance protein
MFETFLTAFTAFFAVIGPVDTAVLLGSMTTNMTRAERRAIAVKAVLIATIIILLFALFGGPVLAQLGVSLAALQTAGGIILLAIAMEMTLSKHPQPAMLTVKESQEAESKAEAHAEIAVFPFATPLLAGPGAMTSAIVLAAGTKGDYQLLGAVEDARNEVERDQSLGRAALGIDREGDAEPAEQLFRRVLLGDQRIDERLSSRLASSA